MEYTRFEDSDVVQSGLVLPDVCRCVCVQFQRQRSPNVNWGLWLLMASPCWLNRSYSGAKCEKVTLSGPVFFFFKCKTAVKLEVY